MPIAKSKVKIQKSKRIIYSRILAIALSLLVPCVLCLSPCFAAPSYGTKMPKQRQFFMGLQNHNVFDRDLEGDDGEMESMQDFFLLSFGLADWFSVDLKGGTGNVHQDLVSGGERVYPTFVGGGYGFRLRVWEKDNFKAVCGFQHISIHPQSIDIGPVKHKAVLDDWQFSATASYACKRVTPYLGMKCSRMDYIHWTDGERNRVKSDTDKSVGIIGGLDIALTQRLWINLEGQYFDAEAAAFSLNYSF